MCITVNRRGKYFWDGQGQSDMCNKCDKVWEEWQSEQWTSSKSFEQLTKREDIVVSRDGHSWLSVFASVFASVS